MNAAVASSSPTRKARLSAARAKKAERKNPQLEELEAVAEALGVRVSYEPMTGQVQGVGGLCRVHGEYRVILDRRFGATERVQVLADALRRFETSGVDMSAKTRALLEPPRREAASGPVDEREGALEGATEAVTEARDTGESASMLREGEGEGEGAVAGAEQAGAAGGAAADIQGAPDTETPAPADAEGVAGATDPDASPDMS